MRELSNEALYDILSQKASDLPKVLVKTSPKSLSLLSKLESQNTKVVAILMTLQIKRHTIPHLKALICSIDNIIWQGCESANGSATLS